MNWWEWIIVGACSAAYLYAWRWTVRWLAWSGDSMNPHSRGDYGSRITPTKCGMGWLIFSMFVAFFVAPAVILTGFVFGVGKALNKCGSEYVALKIKGFFPPLSPDHQELVREKGGLK